jgi:hypothetical protein
MMFKTRPFLVARRAAKTPLLAQEGSRVTKPLQRSLLDLLQSSKRTKPYLRKLSQASMP